MPPRKPAPKTASKTNVNVFKDQESPSQNLRSSKRKRTTTQVMSQKLKAPKLQRAALGAKSANSTDNSIHLSTISFKKEEITPVPGDENPVRLNKRPLRKEETPEAPEPDAFAISFIKPGPIHDYLAQKLQKSDLLELHKIIDGGIEDAQRAATFLSKLDCWSPDILESFGNTAINSLDLSAPFIPAGEFLPIEFESWDLLKPLFLQGCFQNLQTLTLRNRRLCDDDVALFRVLPALESLDLSGTSITNQALHHLVCHKSTLKKLNISMNDRITDDARIMISALSNLTSIFLRGTSFSLPAIRKLAMEDVPFGCRILSLPAQTLNHLNIKNEKYSEEIPYGYVSNPDPERLANMTLPNLKKNLELHAKANKDIQITGTKPELVHRLKTILWNRVADIKIISIVGLANPALATEA